jgi:tetratricopeptide (TPR) repeat protein
MVIELHPTAGYGYTARGESKGAMKDYTGAIADYTLAIKNDPNFAEAYYARALTNITRKQNGGGCDDLKKAIELGHDRAQALFDKYCK